MFVWIFHRISGILLVVLLCFQLFTGFYQASSSDTELVKKIAGLHKHAALNCLLVLAVIFHALYGIRTILIDLGCRRERLLFWGCNILGPALFFLFLVLFFTRVTA